MNLITWNTYMIRRDLKTFWYKLDKDNDWWVWNILNEDIEKIIKDNDLFLEEIEDKELPKLSKLDYNILYAKKRLTKWDNKYLKNITEAETTRMSEGEREFLSLWEPIKIGHHSEKRHRKLYDKIDRDFERRWQAYKEAEDAEDKKEYWEEKLKMLEAQKKGTWKNAKQRKEERIEFIKSKIKVWDKILYNRVECIILKINKKTIFTDNYSFNIDIDYIDLIKEQWQK